MDAMESALLIDVLWGVRPSRARTPSVIPHHFVKNGISMYSGLQTGAPRSKVKPRAALATLIFAFG
jgi:hypothetical protein